MQAPGKESNFAAGEEKGSETARTAGASHPQPPSRSDPRGGRLLRPGSHSQNSRLCLRLLPAPDSSSVPGLPLPCNPVHLQPSPRDCPGHESLLEPARPPYHARRGAAPPPARRLCVSAVCCDWTRSSGPGSEGGVSRGCGGGGVRPRWPRPSLLFPSPTKEG